MGLGAGVIRETQPGERRVAIVPKVVEQLKKAGIQVHVERGAGLEAGFSDAEYEAKGATLWQDAREVCENSQIIASVQVPDSPYFNSSHIVVGFCDPLSHPDFAAKIANRGATLFSMELVPRITRAQAMDALSSMASVAGYKAVLLAAAYMPRLMPMMTTAAGTIAPARVLILGAGVAGLQAIATARRLGAMVTGYDVRPTVKEQVESLGARFLDLGLDTKQAEGSGGYAKALDEEFYKLQRERMTAAIAEQDVVITTAAIPGKKAPLLVTTGMVHAMKAGSVIVDLAAERGGNCELTKAGETVVENGVSILGPLNVAATVPYDTSVLYARNIVSFLGVIVKKGELQIDLNDQIVSESLVARGGQVVHPRVLDALKALEVKA